MPIHAWVQHEHPPVFRCRSCLAEVKTADLVREQHRWEREHKQPYPIGLMRPDLDRLSELVKCGEPRLHTLLAVLDDAVARASMHAMPHPSQRDRIEVAAMGRISLDWSTVMRLVKLARTATYDEVGDAGPTQDQTLGPAQGGGSGLPTGGPV